MSLNRFKSQSSRSFTPSQHSSPHSADQSQQSHSERVSNTTDSPIYTKMAGRKSPSSRLSSRSHSSGHSSGHSDPQSFITASDTDSTRGNLDLVESDIKSILNRLKPYVDYKVDNLPDDIKNDFDRLHGYVQPLYDTPEYEIFYALIEEKYGHLQSVDPLTVGAYIGGCTVSNNFPGQMGCAASCAASIPRPKSDKTFQHCDYTVLEAEYNSYGYNIVVMKEGYGNIAYLQIKTDSNSYKGFTEREKSHISGLGIEQVKVFSVSSNGRDYTELTGLIDVCDLKSAEEKESRCDKSDRPRNNKHKKEKQCSSYWIWWVILIIVVILLFVFIGWKYMKGKSVTADPENCDPKSGY